MRRACEPFTMDGPDFVRCRAAHLTNISVQKQHPRFGEDRFCNRHAYKHVRAHRHGFTASVSHRPCTASVWDAHQLRAFLRQRFGGDNAYEKLTQDITRVMRECLLAVLPQVMISLPRKPFRIHALACSKLCLTTPKNCLLHHAFCFFSLYHTLRGTFTPAVNAPRLFSVAGIRLFAQSERRPVAARGWYLFSFSSFISLCRVPSRAFAV